MLSINSLISETAKKWKRKAKIYREKRNYFFLLNENGEVKKNHTAALQEREYNKLMYKIPSATFG